MTCRARILVPLLAASVLATPALAAKSKGGRDLVVQSPGLASASVHSIALLPVCSFDGNVRAENMAASYASQHLKDTGYRWISASTSRELLHSALGDSMLVVLRQGILRTGRVDSLMAPLLCQKLHSDAVLSLRIDQWEQSQVNWDQSGKPTTSVRLAAALVDSAGEQLWAISGGDTGEGPFHDPSLNPPEILSHPTMATTPLTGENGPPRYEEVLNRLLLRWAEQFPRLVAAEPAR